MSRTLRSIAPALVLLVAFSVSAGAAHAVPLPGRVTPSQPAGLLAAGWEWLTGLFVLGPGRDAAQESRDKAGWEMDPNGLPAPIAQPMSLTSPTPPAADLDGDPDA